MTRSVHYVGRGQRVDGLGIELNHICQALQRLIQCRLRHLTKKQIGSEEAFESRSTLVCRMEHPYSIGGVDHSLKGDSDSSCADNKVVKVIELVVAGGRFGVPA